MIEIKNLKYKWSIIGVVVGILIEILNSITISAEIFYISDITNYLPKLILTILFGHKISPTMVTYGFWIAILLYPIIFGLIGFIIDIIISKNKKSK